MFPKNPTDSGPQDKRALTVVSYSNESCLLHPEPVTNDDEFELLLSRSIFFKTSFVNIGRFGSEIFTTFRFFYLSMKEMWKKARREIKSIFYPF